MPKRTCIWSNSALIRRFEDVIRLRRKKKKAGKGKAGKGKVGKGKAAKTKPVKKPAKSQSGVVTYINKSGKRRCHGTALLKRSQFLGCSSTRVGHLSDVQQVLCGYTVFHGFWVAVG